MRKSIFLSVTSLFLATFSLISCESENETTTTTNTSTTALESRTLTTKKLVKEYNGDFVIIKDLNLIDSGIETFESNDDFKTERMGEGIITRKFDDSYQLHELKLPIDIYNKFISEGIEDNELVVLMTPGEYIDAIALCVLNSKTPLHLKICVGATTIKMIADCINATELTEHIHCW